MFLDDGVHALVDAGDGVRRAGLGTQRAAYAPVFVDYRDRARALGAMGGVERAHRLPGDGSEPDHAFGAAGRTLVDRRLPLGDGAGIGSAIGVAAARALRLRQGGLDARRQQRIAIHCVLSLFRPLCVCVPGALPRWLPRRRVWPWFLRQLPWLQAGSAQ